MKNILRLVGILFVILVTTGCERDFDWNIVTKPELNETLGDSTLHKEVFGLLDLNKSGLEKVKTAVADEDFKKAAAELLAYYRAGRDVRHPEINLEDKASWKGKDLPEKTKEMALNGMKHLFFVHDGYGYFDYGEDINWQYWPVKDNEVRWQLNRMYWWIPMGKMYLTTGDEKFAEEWVFQYRDWIKDNPLGLSAENDRFAWRSLETSRRLEDQTTLFNIFLDSEHFTPEFLTELLLNYHTHAERVSNNYSKQGNHLLFEAQRMLYAGGFFQEFKDAPRWRNEGIAILNDQINEQVNEDGYQYELSPDYHVGAIITFLKGLEMARLINFENEFPEEYSETIRKMIHATIKVSYPDLTYPMFGDAKLANEKSMRKKYKSWLSYFPNDKVIGYYASNGSNGVTPDYLSSQLLPSGFHTFRNGWSKNSTVLIMRAGIPGGPFHSQPDNGTFELWHKGVNLMPDPGSYVYSGDEEVTEARNWYRQSSIHQTLTLNDKDINVDAKQLKWSTSNNLDYTVYENASYNNLKHRRSVFFVDKKFFVFIDEAIGVATGEVTVRFQAKEGSVNYDTTKNIFWSTNANEPNVQVQSFSDSNINSSKEDLKVSYHYKEELPRKGVAFSLQKSTQNPVRMISVVYPSDNNSELPITDLKGEFIETGKNKVSAKVTFNGKDYNIGYDLN